MHKNPYGGIQEDKAFASEKARKTFSGEALSTLCNDTLLFAILVFLELIVKP
jgi:hypothetical protein